MKPRNLKVGQAIRLFWLDSAEEHGWKYNARAFAHEPGKIVSLGYVVGHSKNALTLSTSIDNSGGFISPISIPWKAIVKIERLEEQYDRNSITIEKGQAA